MNETKLTHWKMIAHPFKIDLNKKRDSKQKTIQTFNIDGQRFRKTENGSPLTQDVRVAR